MIHTHSHHSCYNRHSNHALFQTHYRTEWLRINFSNPEGSTQMDRATFPTLARLQTLEEAWEPEYNSDRQNKRWKSLLGSTGLGLIEPTRNLCKGTPINLLSFAQTGDADAHFGLVLTAAEISENLPIALCAPEESFVCVIAENLHEFLCIGCLHGWNSLEDLAFNRPNTIENYQNLEIAREWSGRQKSALLQLLRNEFNLSWTPLSSSRIEQLQSQYGDYLKDIFQPKKDEPSPAAAAPEKSFDLAQILNIDGKEELTSLLNKK